MFYQGSRTQTRIISSISYTFNAIIANRDIPFLFLPQWLSSFFPKRSYGDSYIFSSWIRIIFNMSLGNIVCFIECWQVFQCLFKDLSFLRISLQIIIHFPKNYSLSYERIYFLFLNIKLLMYIILIDIQNLDHLYTHPFLYCWIKLANFKLYFHKYS